MKVTNFGSEFFFCVLTGKDEKKKRDEKQKEDEK